MSQVADRKSVPPPPPDIKRRTFVNWVIWASILVALGWSYQGTDMSPMRFIEGIADAADLLSDFVPPDWSNTGVYWAAMVETIQMAIWGSFLATFLAVPLAFWGSRNVTKNPALYYFGRGVMDVLRGLNEFVLGLIFVAAIGLGPFPGVLALTLHTAGVVGKLLSESIEAVDHGQIEAVEATGASRLQVLTHGYWPQISPMFTSFTLYHFEVNVRSATVLGLVGAGGIGFYLQQTMRAFSFQEACVVVLIVLGSVVVIDKISAKLREWLV